jgi:hypothetical protein
MHFGTKSYLKSTRNHTTKHALKINAWDIFLDASPALLAWDVFPRFAALQIVDHFAFPQYF